MADRSKRTSFRKRTADEQAAFDDSRAGRAASKEGGKRNRFVKRTASEQAGFDDSRAGRAANNPPKTGNRPSRSIFQGKPRGASGK